MILSLFLFLLQQPLEIKPTVKVGDRIYFVEVVRTPEEWRRGLMERTDLKTNQGMLFWGTVEKDQSFWMKNTPLSLDILFIRRDLKIVSIQKKTVPFSETPLPSRGKALHVLEILGGQSDEHGFRPGMKVEFRNIHSK